MAMQFTSYVAWQVLIIAVVALASFVIGKGLFGPATRYGGASEAGLYTPAGIGVLILLCFVLGVLRLFYFPVLLVAGLGLAGFAGYRIRRHYAFNRAAMFPSFNLANAPTVLLRAAVVVAIAVLVIPIFFRTLTPPLQSDEIRYHLPYALHFVESGAIIPDLTLRYPFFSLNINLFYALGLMIGDDVTPHLQHFLFGLLIAVNCYALTKAYTDTVAAIAAAGLFMTLPVVINLAGSAYIDLGLACFVFASLACVYFASIHGNRSLLFCAALLFGIGLGAKYLALAYIPLFAGWVWFHTRDLKTTARVAGLSLLFGAPWYLYNAVAGGNPVSPFLGNLFGYWPLSEADMVLHSRDLNGIGLEKSATAFLALPYNLLTKFRDFQIPLPPYLIAFSLLAIPVAAFIDGKVRPWAVLAFIFVVIWFLSSQSFRYLTTALPILCFLAAWMVSTLGQALARMLRQPAFSVSASQALVAVVFAAGIIAQYAANPFSIGLREAQYRVQQRQDFLRDNLDEYGVIEYFKNSGLDHAVIYQIRAGALPAYLREYASAGDVFGIYGIANYLLEYGDDIGGFVDDLAGQGFTHLVIRQGLLGRQPGWSGYFRGNHAALFEDDNFVIFDLSSRD